MSKVTGRTDWAAEEEEDDPLALPPPEVVKNDDGTETHISYKWREDGKKVKTTRIIRRTVIKSKVNPRIAERRTWPKFGAAAKDPPGPQSDTTTVGENIPLHPRQGYKGTDRGEEAGSAADQLLLKKEQLKNANVKCRICKGDHFTARCPFKGTIEPEGEPGFADVIADPMSETGVGAGGGKSSYVPPALRKGGAASAGEKMPGGKYERDDLATLRVTNVSEYAEENELRDMFERCGRVTRVFLAKDRDTGRAKGFAFVSFADRNDAAKACEKMDGFGYNNLILRVEFAAKKT